MAFLSIAEPWCRIYEFLGLSKFNQSTLIHWLIAGETPAVVDRTLNILLLSNLLTVDKCQHKSANGSTDSSEHLYMYIVILFAHFWVVVEYSLGDRNFLSGAHRLKPMMPSFTVIEQGDKTKLI